jgi:E3 ubiquitin-protein ligase SHPRH
VCCPQWVEELQRHILPGSLSIKVYSGQPQAATPAAKGSSRSRSSSPAASNVRGAAAATAANGKAAASDEVVTAAQLAAADVVLTTYDIIRREVVLQPQTEGAPERSLRHRKRCAPTSQIILAEVTVLAVSIQHLWLS